MGCIGSLIAIILLICAVMIIISLAGGFLLVCATFYVSIICIYIILTVVKIVCSYVKRKYNKRMKSGKPTFMRKFLDMLNMDNWGKESDIKDNDTMEIVEEIVPEDETEVVIVENVDGEIEELVQRAETQIITIEENIHPERIEERDKTVVETVVESPKPKTVEEKPKPIERKQKPKRRYMRQYDIEQFAKECNAYMVREERRERQEQEEKAREENNIEEENTKYD